MSSQKNKKKGGLGSKGLEALLADVDAYKAPHKVHAEIEAHFSPAITQNPHFEFLEIANIVPNPVNPRKDFAQEALEELAFSISQHGVIQPITVRKKAAGKYEIISGERRFRASQIAGKTTIPAYIHPEIEEDFSTLELALIENIQREDLNAIEIAISYDRLLNEFQLSQEQLSDRVAKKRSTVTNYLRLLRLCPEIQAAIRDQKISMGHARALLSLEQSPDKQLAIFALILENELSVRQTEELIRGQKEEKSKTSQTKKETAKNNPYYEEIKEKLMVLFDAPVQIVLNKNGKGGNFSFQFKSEEDIERILSNLGF